MILISLCLPILRLINRFGGDLVESSDAEGSNPAPAAAAVDPLSGFRKASVAKVGSVASVPYGI